MTFVSTALAMMAVLFGLGAPSALLVLPRRWRMHWPVIAPLAGVALVALGAWVAITSGSRVSGTWVWAIVVVAMVPVPIVGRVERGRVARLVLGGLRCHFGVLTLAIVGLLAVARPLTQARLGLTSVSFGSCDAADYAAGAALMRDVPPGDLAGFNGQAETVTLHSADTFYAHWLRLNHFAPAAVLAWFSVLLGMPLFKLVTALGVALHALAVPAVFWVARAGLRTGALGAWTAAAAWVCSAPAVYAIAQTALGQIMVVPAVAVLTWVGLRAQAEGVTWRGSLRWAPVAGIAFVVLVAAYTFALVFVLAPLAASLVWLAWRSRAWSRLGRAAVAGLVAFSGVGLMFRERMAGLADRFALFEAIDFGWPIPVFTPERWLGWFGDANLGAGPASIGWSVTTLVAGGWLAYLAFSWRRDLPRIGVAGAWLVAVAGGYSLLASKGAREGSNELYNAYKVFSLLHPLALAALVLPLRGARGGGHGGRLMAGVLAGALVGVHWVGAAAVREGLLRPALWVDKPLQSIQGVASRPAIESVNMLLEPMWARLWANSMLLNKRQYFRTDTYEGRRATPLRGTWDLRDGLLGVDAGPADTLLLAGGYHLVRRSGGGALQVDLGPGWHGPEGSGDARWAWSSGEEAALRFVNLRSVPVTARLEFALQGNGARTAVVTLGGRPEPLWSGEIAEAARPVTIQNVVLAPGESLVRIRTMEPTFALPGDGRQLGFALHRLTATIDPRESQHE